MRECMREIVCVCVCVCVCERERREREREREREMRVDRGGKGQGRQIERVCCTNMAAQVLRARRSHFSSSLRSKILIAVV